MKKLAESEAYVLHIKPYRETSALVTCFTKQAGRLGFVAKGYQRPRSSMRGALQAFQKLWVMWPESRGMSSLYQADILQVSALMSQQSRIVGLYTNELLYRLLPEQDAQPGLFGAYESVLSALQGVNWEAPLRYFELALIMYLGYGLDFEYDTAGSLIMPEKTYVLDVQQGFTDTDAQIEGSFSGRVLIGLRDKTLSVEDFKPARRLLKQALAPHLAGKPLHSRQLMRSWIHEKSSGC